jgi:hypothetical protein
MDISRSFSFVTEDEQWVGKILLGGIITLIPFIGPFFLLGYMLKLAEQVGLDNPRPLPAWSDFGDLLMRGLYYFVIALVYLIPSFVLMGIWVCIISVGASASASDSADNVGGSLAVVLSCIFVPLVFILTIGGSALSTIATARYLVVGQLSAAFDFGPVIRLAREHGGLWLMWLLLAILSSFLASFGLIACGFGVLFTGFYAYCVQGHGLGQIVRTIRAGTDDSLPPTPVTIQL